MHTKQLLFAAMVAATMVSATECPKKGGGVIDAAMNFISGIENMGASNGSTASSSSSAASAATPSASAASTASASASSTSTSTAAVEAAGAPASASAQRRGPSHGIAHAHRQRRRHAGTAGVARQSTDGSMQFSDAVVQANEDYQSSFQDDPVGSTLKYGDAMKDAAEEFADSMSGGSKESKDSSEDSDTSPSRSSRKKKQSHKSDDAGLLPRQGSEDQTDQTADAFTNSLANADNDFKANVASDPVGSSTKLGGSVFTATKDYADGLGSGIANQDAAQQQQRRRSRQFRRSEADDKIAAASSASEDLATDLQKADEDYVKGVTNDPIGSSVEYASDVADAASTYMSKLSPAVRDTKNGKAQDFFEAEAKSKRAKTAATSTSTDPTLSKVQTYETDLGEDLDRYNRKLKANSAKGGADVGSKDSKAASEYATSLKETTEMYDNTISSPVQ